MSSFTLTTEQDVCSGVAGAEASSCQPPVIHKKVGDTVELSSCSSAEDVDGGRWRHDYTRITDTPAGHFEGRLDLNPTNFSLTLSQLTVSDSGQFKFISNYKSGGQRATIIVRLQVHGETGPQLWRRMENTFKKKKNQ